MLRLGFVGASADKLTPQQSDEIRADIALFSLIHSKWGEEKILIISGRSPKGGVDIFAEEIAEAQHLPTEIFEPHKDHQHWSCQDSLCYGYKARNMDIAKSVDKIYAFVSKNKDSYCYHCSTYGHLVSGACWTIKKAKQFGKETHIIVR